MRKNQGVTLVELSIVIVIISLLVGSVLLGSDLIKDMQLKSIWTDSGKYIAALNSFKGKYDTLPGDMKDAETYWGSATGCPTGVASVTGTATCNGDGNGRIGTGFTVTSSSHEPYTAWQHLANAGFIPNKNYSPKIPVFGGDYGVVYCVSAADGASCTTAILGIPPTRYYAHAGFNIVSPDDSLKWLYFANVDYGNTFIVSGNIYWAEMFSNNELMLFDRKFDDGLPFAGKVQTQVAVHGWGYYPCNSGQDYSLGNVRKCPMIILTGF